MGNKEIKHKTEEHNVVQQTKKSDRKNELESVFDRIAGEHHSISEKKLDEIFGKFLGSSIFHHLSNGGESAIDKNCFINRAGPFFGTSSAFYYSLLAGKKTTLNREDASSIMKACSHVSNVTFDENADQQFLKALFDPLIKSDDAGCEIDEFKSWAETNCPRLIINLQRNVASIFKSGECLGSDVTASSTMLTPFQMWFMQCCIPLSYLTIVPGTKVTLRDSSASAASLTWSLLYSSREHGLSPNRFETKVFNYRSPTVLIIKMNDNKLYVVGVDVEWRQGSQSFGGSDCFVYEITPKFQLLDEGTGLIFYNTKLRTCANGILIGKNQKTPCLKIDPDFFNLADMEVWGCGSAETAAAQMDQRTWEKRQAEKHAKVPLPGNWEENPDRELLEMGGVKVSHAER